VGRSVTFGSLTYKPVTAGVARAATTADDVRKMSAQVLRMDPGATLEASVPEGCDLYLFMLAAEGCIAVDGCEKLIATESFAAIGEGQSFLEFHIPGAFTTVKV
jgi:hypothetical protein